MRQKRFAACAAAIALAGSLSAQQTGTAPAPSTTAPPTGITAAPPPGSPIQTVPGAVAMVETDQLGPIENAGTLRIRAGSGTVVTMQTGIMRVAVGDERLLAVHVLEPREILLQGLIAGRSTLFVWLTDRRRLRYDVIVVPKIDVLRSSLRDLDPGIEAELSADGAAIVLRGDVPAERVAREAERITATIVGGDQVRVVNLLRFPAASTEVEQSFAAALESIDPRIRVRRIQVAGSGDSIPTAALVLEGRVRNLSSLVRAITIADLQMGGSGGRITPVAQDEQGLRGDGSGSAGIPGLQNMGRGRQAQGTLATFVARGLILRSDSGKVLSFLEVDELPQIMVSIRALQIDRGKARRLGVDYRLDAKHVSIGSYNNPRAIQLTPPEPGDRPSLTTGAGNLLAAFVDQTVAITAAIDLLESRSIARSVAEPNITTLSGEQASVLVGGEVPIPTTTVGQVTAVQGFNFQSFGVRLDIRPTLNPNGVIALELAPSIIRPSADLAVGGVPGFEVQTVQTNAKVAPGQSLLIGGLLSFDDVNERRGVPGLSQIPVVKHLFSWESKSASEKELIFIITPRVVSETSVERPLDEVQWSNVEPLPFGKAPALPPIDTKDDKTFRAHPPAPVKPNGLPADIPLQPTVAPQPDVVLPVPPARPIVVPAPAPSSTGAAVVAPPMSAPAPTMTASQAAVDPSAASTPAASTTAETAPAETTAQARPAPQAPRSELPPPPTPTNPD